MSNLGNILADIVSRGESQRATEEAKFIEIPSDSPKWSKTQKVLAKMLRENTGVHILDSGGANGRAWQHNLGIDFKHVMPSRVRFSVYNAGKDLCIELTHHIFHWLSECVEYDAKMSRLLKIFGNSARMKSENWFHIVQEFPVWLEKRWECEIGGIYGEGPPVTINTYNHECLLSQNFQFTFFKCTGGEHDGEEYAAIFLHNGADARGGYTDPLIFKASIDHNDTIGIMDFNRGSISPNWMELEAFAAQVEANKSLQPSLFPTPEQKATIETFRSIRWTTDDGYRFFWDGVRDENGRELDKYPFKTVETRDKWEKGTLCVLPNGTGLCPITGCALESWYF